ncbi:MAG: chloride channel protein [Kofleriaceae bacterium]|nr:chloride channel protein [Kofleriaceae bacterium]
MSEEVGSASPSSSPSLPPADRPSRWTTAGRAFIGALLGGTAGALAAILTTQLIKWMLEVLAEQRTWMYLVMPLVAVCLSVLVLNVVAQGEAVQRIVPLRFWRGRATSKWYVFPRDVARADLTADVVATAGEEEKFPWRLAPIRAVAILATVGLGAPMGTEAPAAHLGVAAGSWLKAKAHWRPFVRPAAIAGGAAGVAALMGIPLVGTAFMLELGRRRGAPLSFERVVAALIGGLVGWELNVVLGLNLIRLVVPKVPPADLTDAVLAALCIGAIAGAVTSITGALIYEVRGWKAGPVRKLVVGGLAMLAGAIAVSLVATPAAAVGPGGAAIVWAETTQTAALTLLALGLLRAAMTISAVAAGGCGGVFVPFLAIGDITGRVFSEVFGVPPDLAGSAGAAAGIAGGYRLPWTAVMMVLGVGGPYAAMLTCLATVGVATAAAIISARGLTHVIDWIAHRPQPTPVELQ